MGPIRAQFEPRWAPLTPGSILRSNPTHLSFEKRSCKLASQYIEGSRVGGINRYMEISYPKGYTTVNPKHLISDKFNLNRRSVASSPLWIQAQPGARIQAQIPRSSPRPRSSPILSPKWALPSPDPKRHFLHQKPY